MSLGSALPIRHEAVPGDGVRLHVTRAGSGPPLVLLHGFPEDGRAWHNQLAPLAAAGFDVLVPDLRGYHRSGRPAERTAYALRHLVADVAALVRHASGGPAHVAGHDWGGVIAWAFAAAHPELLDRLAILNAPHPGIYLRAVRRPPQLWRAWYVALFRIPRLAERVLAARDFAALRRVLRRTERPGAIPEARIDDYIRALREPGALTAALDYYRAFRGEDLARAARARTDAPTLVLWGEKDRALDVGLLNGLERYATNLRVERIADASHWIQHDAPERVTRALLRHFG